MAGLRLQGFEALTPQLHHSKGRGKKQWRALRTLKVRARTQKPGWLTDVGCRVWMRLPWRRVHLSPASALFGAPADEAIQVGASPDEVCCSTPVHTSSMQRLQARCARKTVEQIYQKKTQLEHILLRQKLSPIACYSTRHSRCPCWHAKGLTAMWATASVLHAKLRDLLACFCQILLPSKVFLLCTSAVAQALSSGSSSSCGLFLEGAAAIPAWCP